MGQWRRVQTAGMYHVMNRAVANTWLFLEEADYDTRMAMLADAVRHGRMRLHQFCLMGNHEHLLLSVEDDELAKLMQRLNRSYAGNFNRVHRRRGRLFDGPYESVPVVSERHLIELIRYIALNPEQISSFGRAETYRYSSYSSLIGLTQPLSFVDPEPLYGAVGGADPRRRIIEIVADGRLRKRAA